MTTPLDTPWKQILECYFPHFIAFFFPEAYSEIDWSQGFDFLESELQQVTREAETGKRIVDKLVKVYLRNGKENWILLHVEIQNQKEADFSQRIYIYSARLFDKFRREVSSFAVLGDTDRDWRPQSFTRGKLGTKGDFSFPIAKLVDYKQRKEELTASDNPFAVVVRAHLAAQATKNKDSQQRRRKQKYALSTMLYERGWSEQQVIDLYRFIDWVLTLPLELEEAFREDLKTYEEQNNMPYISSIERTGRAEGEAKGRAEGKAEGEAEGAFKLVSSLLRRQLREVPESINETIKRLSIAQLEQLALDLSDFQAIEDLTNWLEQFGKANII